MMRALFDINPNSSPTVTDDIATGCALHDHDGAAVLTFDRAGMARYRPVLEQML